MLIAGLDLFTMQQYLLNQGKNKESLELSNKLIQRNDSIAEVYYNAGLAYFNMAVELDKNTHLSRKRHQELTGYYQKALPYLAEIS